MPAIIIDGRSIANAVLTNLREQVVALGVSLHLAAVGGGSSEALKSFVKLKQKAAQSIGVTFSSYFLEDANELAATLDYLAADDSIHGIFVELPLPKDWNPSELLSHIPTAKDVDIISPAGESNFYGGDFSVLPPAVKALEYVLDEHGIEITTKSVAVIGQGKLIGRPIVHWLRSRGAEVTAIDIDTSNPGELASRSDIVIAGAGSAGLVKGDWVKDGAVVIDYGFNDGKQGIVGDVDFSEVSKKASLITPVPGGMGPLVIAAVLDNLLSLASD